MRRKLSITAILILIILLLGYSGYSTYVATNVMRIPRTPVGDSPASVGLEYSGASFPSRVDNVTLRGWYIPGGDSCIVIVNGGNQSRVDLGVKTLEMARDLHARGFSVLLFDLRGRGESEGQALTLTNGDRDIGGAVDYAKSKDHSAVYIIAFSTGAANSIFLRDGVTAMVLDSCFGNIKRGFIQGAVQFGYAKPLAQILSPGVFMAAKIIYGYDPVNPEDLVGSVTYPILFIYGQEDAGISYEDIYRLFNGTANPLNRLWIVPEAGHCQAYKINPTEYIERVATFFGGSP